MARHGKSKARAKRPPPPMPSMAPFLTGSRARLTPTAEPSPPRFTMQQAARNTETHNKSWNNESLRHKAVRFVSAGQLEQDEQQNADREEDQSEETPNTIDPKDHSKVAKESSPEADDNPFFIDSIGDRAAVTDLPYPIISSDRLNSDDDESEDEVVFTGRQNTRTPIRIETDGDQLLKSLNIQATQMRPTIPPANPPRDPVQRRSSPDRRHRQRWSPEVEVDMLADYIANIDQDYNAPEQDDVTDVSTAETGTNVRHSATDSADEVAQIVTYPKSSLEIQGQTDEVRMQIFTDGTCAILSQNHSYGCHDSPIYLTGLSKVDLDARSDSSSTSEDEDEDVLEYLEESDEELEETEDQEEDIEMLEELAISHLLHGGNKGRSVGKHGFPSASAFADALESDPYYGFDIMDFERPSLQKKPKGKNAPLIGDYMSSDSELEAQLQRAWQTDRQKKKSKKKEREIMRSQGLLGRDPGDADLKVKYAKGMHIEELISEIRTFLLSSKTRYV